MKKKGFSNEKPCRGVTNEWHTPPELLEALKPYDDDPAMPGQINGLIREWKGFVFLNPPYGPECGTWVGKLAQHGNGIALIFARTETKWFYREVWKRADAIMFIIGRLKFLRNGTEKLGNAGAPSCLVAYGDKACDRLANSGIHGVLVYRKYGWE